MKYLLVILFAGLLILTSCNKEPAVEPNAQFTTNLVDNTANAGETFYMYLDNCRGDFYSLYRGLTPSTTYSDTTIAQGTDIDTDTDSIAVTYTNAGTYKLTFIASSSGNWAEDYKTDIYSLMINVVDDRTAITSMTVGVREGQITAENEILFYAHKNEDISNERVKFITASADATVYVDGETVETGRFRLDFSALSPDDSEGRPQVFTVESLNGDTEEYTAKFILREPSSEKILYGLSSSDLDAEFTIDESNKTVTVSYYEGVDLQGGLLADESPGAVVIAGGEEIQEDEEDVDLSSVETITVIAEDNSEQDYEVVLYEKERITAYNFTSFMDEGSLTSVNPVLRGDVNFDARSIDMEVPVTLPLDSLVASYEGIVDFSVTIAESETGEETDLESGISMYDYSFDTDMDSKVFYLRVYDNQTLIDTYMLTVRY